MARRASKLIRNTLLWGVPALTGLYVVGGVAPPLFMAVGANDTAEVIRRVYSVFCHQIPERSFAFHGVQFAFCARCTGFYAALFLTGLTVAIFSITTPLRLLTSLLLMIPILVDFIFDLSTSLPYSNLLRMTVGLIGGMSCILFVFPRVIAALADR